MLATGKGSIPLYLQIIELLVARISNGEWMPGDLIPSEINLAKELNVSQGTVRKAITELVENNVLTRKQGRGTFVSNHNSERALFHFFHISDNQGQKVLPDSEVSSCRRKKATAIEVKKLHLQPSAQVIRIERVRKFSSRATIVETVVLPAEQFRELENENIRNLPNMLYELYEKQFGITIHSAEEQLRAVKAKKHEAKILGVEPGHPLLMIERVALMLDKTPIELRISRCNTIDYYYENTLF